TKKLKGRHVIVAFLEPPPRAAHIPRAFPPPPPLPAPPRPPPRPAGRLRLARPPARGAGVAAGRGVRGGACRQATPATRRPPGCLAFRRKLAGPASSSPPSHRCSSGL